MLLTIHNLPASTRYADIKTLLQSKCGLQHVILDNLVVEGSGKKVTVGVAEDADAAILVRKINGLYWNGSQLYVEDVRRQKKPSRAMGKDDVMLLLEIIENTPFALKKETNQETNRLKEKSWSRITSEFNDRSGTSPRSVDQIKSKWDNLKKNARKRAANIRMSTDLSEVPKDDISDKVASMVGLADDPLGGPKEIDLVVTKWESEEDNENDEDSSNQYAPESSTNRENMVIELPLQHLPTYDMPPMSSEEPLPSKCKKKCYVPDDGRRERNLAIARFYNKKTSSDQPFRSNPELQERESTESFRPLNLQQHSSYKAAGLPSLMTRAVQPVTSMYCVPDHNSEYNQTFSSMKTGSFMQTQGFEAGTQKVQGALMGISGFSQTPAQMSQVAQFNKNQDISSEPQNRVSVWTDSYNEMQDFVGERPLYGRRSPDRTLYANWFANQQRRESPQRDRSRDNRVQPWSRGPDSRGPWAPDSRPSRDDQFEPRPDFRSNERAGLPNSQPDFGSEGRRNQFTGRMREFPERQGRPNEREGFHGRSDEFSSNNRHRQNEFAGLSTDRHGPNEFAGRSTDLHGPNEFARRSTDRHGPNEFAGRSTDLHGPNEFSRRSKDRQGPNKFTGRPNEFTGRPSEFNNRPNEGQRRPNEHRGRPNDQGRQNEYQGRQNENQGRRNEYQGRQNEYQVRQNEFSERKERPNRPGFSRPNDHQFDRLDERNKINRLNDREISKRFDSKPKPNFLETRKRKFDDTFDGTIERPERVSCPKNIQQQPPGTQNKNIPLQDPNLIMSDGNKTKLSTRMREAGVRKIVMKIVTCLGIRNPNLDMKRMMRKLVLERLQNLLGDRTMVTPLECCKIYRSTYPNIEDTAILDSALAMLAKQRADKGIVPGATAASKPGSANEPINITGSLKQVYKKMKEAKSLLSQGKLPKFPQGDKRKVAQQKREEKTGHIPEVDPLTKAAIEAELDDIAELFTAEFDSATTLKLQRAYSTVNRSELINDIKMNLTEKLSRRISNTGLIIVRIYGHPKLPQRPVLEKVLLRFGVQSLRKSEKAKMYTAAVDTYKNYDKLMAKRTIDVGDGITISFKPFHLAPKERADQKQLKIMRKKMIEDMIDKSDLNLLDKDWPAKAAEIKRREASNERENATLEAEAQQQIASEAQAQQLAVLEAGGKENYSDTKEDVVGVTDENESNKNDTNDYLHEDFHVIDEVHADSDVEFTENIIETVNIDDDEENENFEASNQDKIENNEVNNEDKIENYEVNNEDKIENNEVNNEDKIENNEVNNEDKIENNEVNNEDKIENYEVNNDDKIENNEMNNEDKIENNEVNNEDNIENYEMNSSNDDGNDGYFEENDPDENNDLDDTQEGNADCDIGDLDIDIDHVDDDDLEDY